MILEGPVIQARSGREKHSVTVASNRGYVSVLSSPLLDCVQGDRYTKKRDTVSISSEA